MIDSQGKKYLGEKEAASIIGLSTSWLRKERNKKRGPSYVRFTEHGKIFYEENSLRIWISKRIIHY